MTTLDELLQRNRDWADQVTRDDPQFFERLSGQQDAWARGQQVSVHGWVYSLHDGRVRDMGMKVAAPEELAPAYETALARLGTLPEVQS